MMSRMAKKPFPKSSLACPKPPASGIWRKITHCGESIGQKCPGQSETYFADSAPHGQNVRPLRLSDCFAFLWRRRMACPKVLRLVRSTKPTKVDSVGEGSTLTTKGIEDLPAYGNGGDASKLYALSAMCTMDNLTTERSWLWQLQSFGRHA